MTAPTPDVLALLEATSRRRRDHGRSRPHHRVQRVRRRDVRLPRRRRAGPKRPHADDAIDRAEHDEHLKRYLAGGEPRVLGQGPRRARAASRRQRIFGIPERRPHPQHLAAAVRRLSARHVAAPQGAGDARKGTAAQSPVPGPGAGDAGGHRSRRASCSWSTSAPSAYCASPARKSSAATGSTAAWRRKTAPSRAPRFARCS